MCGIVGVMGAIGLHDERAFEDLLIVDAVRGIDSTGVLLGKENGQTHVIKNLLTPQDLCLSKEYLDANRTMNRVLLGHNRMATKGKITAKNAHPFDIGNIVGVHNGTLHSVRELEDEKEFETDSEALLNTIDKKGIEHAWKNVRGAAAVVWYDKTTKILHFIRNHSRPLCFAVTKDKKKVFWASETWMLNSVVSRGGRNIELDTVYIPSPHYHFTARISRAGNIVMENTKLQEYVAPPVTVVRNFLVGSDPFPRRADFENEKDYQAAIVEWRVGGDRTNSQEHPPSNVTNILSQKERKRLKRLKNLNQRENVPSLPLAWADMDEKTFYKTYKNCSSCLETLQGEYADAVVLDHFQALCGNCAADAASNQLPYNLGV